MAGTGIVKRVALVSFNANERHAVDLLLSDIASGAPSPWARDGELQVRRAVDDGEWRLQHVPLQAQGNVVAGAQLAEFFADHQRPDYIVFNGCAGALRVEDVASVFLVEFANYLSLGTVQRSGNNEERVTVKNKWLCASIPRVSVGPSETLLESFGRRALVSTGEASWRGWAA